MNIIVRDAEKKLLHLLRDYVHTPAHFCFYLRASQTDIPKQVLQAHFLSLFQDVPDFDRAQVFFCEDKDIFILMDGLSRRQFKGFVKRLSDSIRLEMMARIRKLPDLTEIYEMDIHWGRLEKICKEKIEARRAVQEVETDEQCQLREQEARKAALFNMNPCMAATIAERRRKRRQVLVMVADDDQLSRTLFCQVLGHDWCLAAAVNGREALESYVENAPDVLFLDIGLPDMNGHRVLETLFELDKQAYVIMFSGRKDRENVLKALEIGAQGFVAKPFTRAKLIEYIMKSPFVQDKRSAFSAPDRVVL